MNVYEKIVSIPREFHASGNKSFLRLLRESGYFSLERLDKDNIKAELTEHPEYIQDWLQWSEDKRTSGGPYIITVGDRFEIGCVEGGLSKARLRISDPAEACAEFIVLEIGPK